jgi:hypothetical protein
MSNRITNILLAIFLALTIFPFANATTNLIITSPNGGESWQGTKTITWDFNDTSTSQNIDFNLWYSLSAGSKNFTIAQNLGFEDYCSTTITEQWDNADINYIGGLPAYEVPSTPLIDSAYWEYNSSKYLSLFGDGFLNTYKLVGTNWVLQDINFIGDAGTKSSRYDRVNFETFYINGELYGLLYASGYTGANPSSDSGNAVQDMWGYKFNGTNWVLNSDVNQGITFSSGISTFHTANVVQSTEIFVYGGNTYMLVQVPYLVGTGASGYTYAKYYGFLFNEDLMQWTSYNTITNLDGAPYSVYESTARFSVVEFEGDYYLARKGYKTGTGFNQFYKWNNSSGWITNSDFNVNFPTTTLMETISINGIEYLFGGAFTDDSITGSPTAPKFYFYTNKEFKQSYATQYTSSCEYDWDLSSVNKGTWYLDMVAIGSTTKSDSSDGNFNIVGGAENLLVTCISNCSKSIVGNGINLVNNNENPIIFSVDNQEYYNIDANIYWYNSKRDNTQYLVYSSSDGVNWVFNSTYTYGSTNYNGLQKVWDASEVAYRYYLGNTYNSDTLIYFKLVPIKVPVFYQTINASSDWANLNSPTNYADATGLHSVDVYQDSNLNNIQSYTIKPYPALTSTDLTAGFYVQFTAYASTNTTIGVGRRDINTGTDSLTSISLTTSPVTYSVFVQPANYEDRVLIKSSSNTSAIVYISDYSIVPTGYFVDRLELYTQYGQYLPSIVRSGVSYNYVNEAVGFQMRTRAYNQNNNLSKLRTQVKVSGVTIKTYEYDLNGYIENGTIDLQKILDGVTDYNGSSQTGYTLNDLKDFQVVNTLIDKDNKSVAEQSQTIKLLQYPYSTEDIQLNLLTLTRKVGANPKFNLFLTQRYPKALVGLKLIIYDSSHSKTNPNYQEIIYAKELDCNNIVCQKTITLDKWSYPQETNYTLMGALILTTENQDYNNNLTLAIQNIQSTYSTFETARVLQVFERRNLLYKNTETIPLVFQVRDDALKNLKDDYSVSISIDVNNNGAYVGNSTRFNPQKFIYDDVTGYNYWYFNTLFFSDGGALVPDGNSIRIRAYIVPLKGNMVLNGDGYGLANKCSVYPSDYNIFGFLPNWISGTGNAVLDSLFGCDVVSDPVIGALDLDAQQIIMNNAYTPLAIQKQSMGCIKSDANQEYHADLGDELLCVIAYKRSETQIDKFNVVVGNSYSDYAKKGDQAQYLQFTIPAEEVMFNDIAMMSNALLMEKGTQGTHTWGDLILYGANKILGATGTYSFFNNVTDAGQYFTSNGFIKNVGWDLNFDEQLNPNTYDGLFFFKLNGLQVTNQYDYIADYTQLETLNASNFRTFALANKIFLPNKKTSVIVYSRDFVPILSEKIDSPLVIYEKPTTTQKQVYDSNTNNQVKPTQLKFNIISDMFFANETASSRIVVPMVFGYIVPPAPFSLKAIGEAIGQFISNPIGVGAGFLIGNWFYLLILLMFGTIISVVYLNIKIARK